MKYNQMDDLGVPPPILGNLYMSIGGLHESKRKNQIDPMDLGPFQL